MWPKWPRNALKYRFFVRYLIPRDISSILDMSIKMEKLFIVDVCFKTQMHYYLKDALVERLGVMQLEETLLSVASKVES